MRIDSNIVATESELSRVGVSLDKLKEDLTLPNPEYANAVRFGKGRFYKRPDKYICYLNNIKGNYIVPRYYLAESSLGVMEDGRIYGRTLKSSHKIKLRNYQKEFINASFETLKVASGILLEAPCGHGKTLLGIWLSYYRGKQTLVIVPTYYLARQWQQRIEEFTNGTCHIISAKDTDIPTDSDFTIIVSDLFNCRVLPEELIHNIGHVILDEAHRMGAETYLPILNEIPAVYRTALTATFRRTDGVHKILKYHFGEHVKMPNRFPRPKAYGFHTGCVVEGCVSKNKAHENFISFLERCGEEFSETKSAITYNSKRNNILIRLADKEVKSGTITKTAYKEICACLKRGEEMAYTTVESYLNENSKRKKAVITLIRKCLAAGRTVLFLSKRKDTLRTLAKYFETEGESPMLIVSETNARTPEEEEYLQTKCRLIFGVNQLAKEGLDIDRLDTLIIHLPMADTEQAIGRISRLCDGKKQPVAFYLVDKCPLTYATFSKAKKTFAINADFKGELPLSSADLVV